MKNGLNKFAKGMFAIFTIKLLIFGLIFLNQSCQTDNEDFENNYKGLALTKFESILKSSATDIELIATDKTNFNLLSKSTSEKAEDKAKKSLTPLVIGAKELLKQYDISENDLTNIFGDSNNPNIAILGLMILRTEQLSNKKNETASAESIFFTSTYAQGYNNWDIADCAMSALGLPAGVILGAAGSLSAKAILKIAIQLATRVIGWAVLAVSVYFFTRCLQKLGVFAYSNSRATTPNYDKFNNLSLYYGNS